MVTCFLRSRLIFQSNGIVSSYAVYWNSILQATPPDQLVPKATDAALRLRDEGRLRRVLAELVDPFLDQPTHDPLLGAFRFVRGGRGEGLLMLVPSELKLT